MKRTIGDIIKQLREERGLSQSQLADILNVASSSIGMWENDKRIPGEDTKEAIADYFNVDMNYLYGRTLVRNSSREITSKNDIYFKFQEHVSGLNPYQLDFALQLIERLDTFSDDDISRLAQLINLTFKTNIKF